MTSPTHKQFSITWAAVGAMLLYLLEMTEVNFYLSLIIMLEMGKAGALFPDLDHDWHNVREKNIITWIVNKIIHASGGRHRSWQTHSLDIALVCTLVAIRLPIVLYNNGVISNANREILGVILVGFMAGWLSHLFSDMLTPEGIRISFLYDKKIGFVPRSLLGIRFSTGSMWEQAVYKITQVTNAGVILLCLVFPLLTQGGILI